MRQREKQEPKGFLPPAASEIDERVARTMSLRRSLNRYRQEFYHLVKDFATDVHKIQSYLSFINYVLGIAAKRHKFFDKKANGQIVYRRSLIELARKQMWAIAPTNGLVTYSKRYWKKAWNSKPYYLKVQRQFVEWGLLQVDRPEFSPDERRPTSYYDIRVAELLIMAEVLEGLLTDTAYTNGSVNKSTNLSALPTHRCYALVKMFNTIFAGLATWRRQSDWESTLPCWDSEEMLWEYEFGWELNW